MTEPLIIDGLTYISIRDAAAKSYLSTEYLARLARQHRLRARMLGRTWYFETDSLQQFLSTRTAARNPHGRYRGMDARRFIAGAGEDGASRSKCLANVARTAVHSLTDVGVRHDTLFRTP